MNIMFYQELLDYFQQGYNIDSLTVAPITDSQYSRMTIVTTGDKRVIDQIVKQLNKLIPVLKVNGQKMLLKRYSLMKFSIDNNLSDIDVIACLSWKFYYKMLLMILLLLVPLIQF